MALGSTLFRLNVELSNIDTGVYESLELRLAQHPSEDTARLVARALAHCLAHEAGLVAGRGLSEADDPALFVTDAAGNTTHWIDIGHPSSERLHRASKATPRVTVVCHKSADGLIRAREKRAIHGAERIAVWLISPELVESLSQIIDRNNDWTVVRTGQDLMVTVKDRLFSGTLVETTLSAL
ncbi:MAG TPA: YaeQ family protein [Polyangiaceae bacterium]